MVRGGAGPSWWQQLSHAFAVLDDLDSPILLAPLSWCLLPDVIIVLWNIILYRQRCVTLVYALEYYFNYLKMYYFCFLLPLLMMYVLHLSVLHLFNLFVKIKICRCFTLLA